METPIRSILTFGQRLFICLNMSDPDQLIAKVLGIDINLVKKYKLLVEEEGEFK